MNYIGSKYSLLPFLEEKILQFVGERKGLTFFDVFAGTGIVGRHFKSKGFQIIANDIQYYSYSLNKASIAINEEPQFLGIVGQLPCSGFLPLDAIDVVLNYLNTIPPKKGFVYHNYCPGGTKHKQYPRQYFTDANGMHCDAICTQIQAWYQHNSITEDEYFYLLASLLEAIDKVANTASVYGAFLKHIKSSAQKPLRLEKIVVIPDKKTHRVYNTDGSALVNQVPHDILYMDPPYNQRQYCTNYHVLETIARYDEPSLKGVTGLREYYNQKSAFCSRKRVAQTLQAIIQGSSAKYIFLSYNSEGLITVDEIMQIMGNFGLVELHQQPYRRFRADVDSQQRKYKANGVSEYLFCLEKAT